MKNNVLQYNQVITNNGGAYDATDCVFTAPVQGFYVFFWSVTQNTKKITQSAITKNGAEIVRDSAFALGGDWDLAKSSQTVTMHLVAGDRVWIKYEGPHPPYVTDRQFSSVFTGLRL